MVYVQWFFYCQPQLKNNNKITTIVIIAIIVNTIFVITTIVITVITIVVTIIDITIVVVTTIIAIVTNTIFFFNCCYYYIWNCLYVVASDFNILIISNLFLATIVLSFVINFLVFRKVATNIFFYIMKNKKDAEKYKSIQSH